MDATLGTPPAGTATAHPSPQSQEEKPKRPYLWLGALIVGYIGVYLCRKNLSVAIPLIQKEFGVSRSEIGMVASASTVAYACGKLIFGPIIDRFGGGLCFFASLLLVGLFGGAGAFAGSIASLTVIYSGNRLAGSVAWGSMVKMTPEWFTSRQLPFAMALLSLGFVFGGVAATVLAGEIAAWSGGSWRMVMGGPALALFAIMIAAWIVLPKTVFRRPSATANAANRFRFSQIHELLRVRQFWIVCGLSFTLTLMRETFNTWTVDFFKTQGGPEMSMRIAAFLSTPFDLLGAIGIISLGWVFGRISREARKLLLFFMLGTLSALIWYLPEFFHLNLYVVTGAVGLIGFLAYGPYSLLAGILAVEIRGKEYVATVAGVVDGVGYLAGVFAGGYFGKIVDRGGYNLGFHCLSVLTLAAAVLCLFLYSRKGEAIAG
jgi:sugar phosphate permease